MLYAPELMLSVWLYAYATGITLRVVYRSDWGDVASLSGRGGSCRQLGAERVSSAAWAGAEQRVHAGAGDGPQPGFGQVGPGGDGLHAD